jgi:hypothetical protein
VEVVGNLTDDKKLPTPLLLLPILLSWLPVIAPWVAAAIGLASIPNQPLNRVNMAKL